MSRDSSTLAASLDCFTRTCHGPAPSEKMMPTQPALIAFSIYADCRSLIPRGLRPTAQWPPSTSLPSAPASPGGRSLRRTPAPPGFSALSWSSEPGTPIPPPPLVSSLCSNCPPLPTPQWWFSPKRTPRQNSLRASVDPRRQGCQKILKAPGVPAPSFPPLLLGENVAKVGAIAVLSASLLFADPSLAFRVRLPHFSCA